MVGADLRVCPDTAHLYPAHKETSTHKLDNHKGLPLQKKGLPFMDSPL
jgi:hypothetical protein